MRTPQAPTLDTTERSATLETTRRVALPEQATPFGRRTERAHRVSNEPPAFQPDEHPASNDGMAGGQERILRRRIKSVQSTKKITRCHGAHRGVADRQGAGAGARGPAVRRRHHRGRARPAGRGAGSNNPLLVPRPETRRVGEVVLAADRGLCGAYNSSVIRAGRGRHQLATGAGSRDRDRHRRPQARGLLPLPRLSDQRRRSAGSRRTPPTRTRVRSRPRSSSRSRTASSTSCSSSTRGSSPPAAKRS